MDIIKSAEYQSNFPYEDLNDSNADQLELMLANQALVQNSHQASETYSKIYRIGHPTIVTSMKRIYDNSQQLAAVDHGVAAFEAAALTIAHAPEEENSIITHTNAASLLRTLSDYEFRDYTLEAVERFQAETPRLKEVIETSSRRFHGPLTHYAVLGAAMARRFEIDCAN